MPEGFPHRAKKNSLFKSRGRRTKKQGKRERDENPEPLQEARQYTATSLLVRSSKKFKYMKEVLFSPFSTFLTTALSVYFLVVLKFSCSLTTTLKDMLGPLSSLKMRGYNQDLCLYERGFSVPWNVLF